MPESHYNCNGPSSWEARGDSPDSIYGPSYHARVPPAISSELECLKRRTCREPEMSGRNFGSGEPNEGEHLFRPRHRPVDAIPLQSAFGTFRHTGSGSVYAEQRVIANFFRSPRKCSTRKPGKRLDRISVCGPSSCLPPARMWTSASTDCRTWLHQSREVRALYQRYPRRTMRTVCRYEPCAGTISPPGTSRRRGRADPTIGCRCGCPSPAELGPMRQTRHTDAGSVPAVHMSGTRLARYGNSVDGCLKHNKTLGMNRYAARSYSACGF